MPAPNMHHLSVRIDGGVKRVEFPQGQTLKNILDATNLRVRSACRGNGFCGLCRVRLEAGEANRPTRNERIHLSRNQLRHGVRLACQTVPRGDATITVLNPAPPSQWKRITGETIHRASFAHPKAGADLPGDVKTPYGAAVDLGTSHISVSLYDLLSGERILDRYGINPQTVYGLDVMSRLTVAARSEEAARAMGSMAVAAIGEGLMDMSIREGINIGQVVYLTTVGNTAMLAMIAGKNYDLLLQPARWMEYIECQPDKNDTSAWRKAWGLHPLAAVEVIPPLAGFVGSDLLAGLVSTFRDEAPPPFLFLDFGVNSEIALWNGSSFLVTSAAGGPAFESWGIACGVPAGPGAIYRVNIEEGAIRYDTIDDMKAKGLCGTGLIDLIASLVKAGKISDTGKFQGDLCHEGFTLADGVVLTPADIDSLQRAKAAIGTATEALLSEAGMTYDALGRVLVAGAFGKYLQVSNAQAIGLLPPLDPLKVELMGNTSLAGCEDLMLSAEAAEKLGDIREKSRVINLSRYPDFGDLFLEHLYLRPMEHDGKV